MGTWRYKHFENDGAADFIAHVEEEGISKIYQVILQITELPETEYLELDDCEQALAAIEFVAAAKGNPHEDFPEGSKQWMKDKYVADILEVDPKDPHKANYDITEISLNALERIKTNSEMQELWEESEQSSEWIKEIEDLEKRIS